MPLNLPIAPSELDPTGQPARLRDAINVVDVAPGNLSQMLRADPKLLSPFQAYLSTAQTTAGQTLKAGEALLAQMRDPKAAVSLALGTVPGITPTFAAAAAATFNAPGGVAAAMANTLIYSVLGGYGVVGAFVAQKIIDLQVVNDAIRLVQKNVVDVIDNFLDSVSDQDGWLRGQYAKRIIAPDVARAGLQLLEMVWDPSEAPDTFPPGVNAPGAQGTDNGDWKIIPFDLAATLRYVIVSPRSGSVPASSINFLWTNLQWQRGAPPTKRAGALGVRDVNGISLPPVLLAGSAYKLYPTQPYVEFVAGAHVPAGAVT